MIFIQLHACMALGAPLSTCSDTELSCCTPRRAYTIFLESLSVIAGCKQSLLHYPAAPHVPIAPRPWPRLPIVIRAHQSMIIFLRGVTGASWCDARSAPPRRTFSPCRECAWTFPLIFCDSEPMTQAVAVLSANCMEGFEFLPANKKIRSGTLHFGAGQ